MNEDTNSDFNILILDFINSKSKYQSELIALETQVSLGAVVTPAIKADIISLKRKIKDTDESIADLNKQRNELTKAIKDEALASSLSEERDIVTELVKLHDIGYLVKENRYTYCMGMEAKNSNVVNPIFETVEASKFGRVINKMADKQLKLGQRMFIEELTDHFQKIGKDYYMTTSSFNNDKWGKEKVYNKANIITKYWVTPDMDNRESYDKRFDFLIRCIGGGKQENMDHLEMWTGYKYLNPDKVSNTPNLDIGGFPGGNGKGRYIELNKTVFTNPCVQPAALKELMDGFNGNWELAVMLYYDEPKQDELPEGKLKQATGGEDLRIERKGVDATVADRNYNIVFVSNNPNGVVTLSGTGSSGEDRRYSVMTTSLVMVDEAVKLGKTIEEAKVYVDEISQLIKNRKEVAKWLAHIIIKHDIANMNVLQPLHGKDYYARGNDQKSPMDVAFDKILPIFQENGILPYEILKQVVMIITGYTKLSDKTLKSDWKRYLEKCKITVNYLEGGARPKITYSWYNKDKVDGTMEATKTLYELDGSKSREFKLSSILKRKPTDLRRYKDSFEAATTDQLTIDED